VLKTISSPFKRCKEKQPICILSDCSCHAALGMSHQSKHAAKVSRTFCGQILMHSMYVTYNSWIFIS
jgi:hypothetical protein